MCSPNLLWLVFCSLLLFALPLIFTLLAAISISHFLTATMKFSCFFPTKFVSFVFHHSF